MSGPSTSVAPLPIPVTPQMVENLRISAYSHQGDRPYQEDRGVFIADFNKLIPGANSIHEKRRSFFAIFDGHGGYLVSKTLGEKFSNNLANHPKISIQPLAALQEVWTEFDNVLYNTCREYADATAKAGNSKGNSLYNFLLSLQTLTLTLTLTLIR
jgi:serine/threonine protein phosphatase PrpC